MGCGRSKVFVVNATIPGQGPRALEDFDKICLTQEEINMFYSAFRKFDANGDGTISLVEFLIYLNIEETPLTREVFKEIDRSRDSKMNFHEFTLNIWNYCVRGKAAIADFAFDIFDTDNSEELNEAESAAMVSAIYGGKKLDVQLQRLLKKIDTSRDGIISKKEFLMGAKLYPALLFPAYSMQAALRAAIGGTKYWTDKEMAADSIFKRKEVKALFKKRKVRRVSLSAANDDSPLDAAAASTSSKNRRHSRRESTPPTSRRNSKQNTIQVNDEPSSIRSDPASEEAAGGAKARRKSLDAPSSAPHASRQRRSSEPDVATVSAAHNALNNKRTTSALDKRRHTSTSNRSEIDGIVGISDKPRTKKILPSISGKPPVAPADGEQ